MDIETQAKIFKAIGDVIRIKILCLLPSQPRCEEMYNVGDLVKEIGGSQPNMSRHLCILKEAGLVNCRKACCSVYYWRVPEAFEQVQEYLANFCDEERKSVTPVPEESSPLAPDRSRA
jgi:ArsR family transcriptional regulator